mmetsp:Transcript_67847/g.141469  ORF Transcript_67847/g.141469 Transcript_67847/m.141469 type:complete len:166 (+) Transcript_67847:124-621(+)|eukprot:CAMPEP_0181346104 /NCGR_PEP_ID=MMETSP1101-20121128/33136_1 /TAXON_ID=46948 /ORGANISM="Rhodomonas abbreviata, Strain Caron Lab Isolate" /LENGTH=165 /DNA_ID=CAMNT_0023458167 /DNA_START=117 /DNA_END=614 /DNA_ORIENTATION=+
MGFMDICDADENMPFVAVLLGLCGLNFILVTILFIMFLKKKGGESSPAQGQATPKDTEAPAPKANTKSRDDGAKGSDYKDELLSVQRALTAMERKIDNKRINEVTSSYLLHNAHDAIGNGVPTAAQVTLEQIAGHQAHTHQKIADITTHLHHMEDMVSKILSMQK